MATRQKTTLSGWTSPADLRLQVQRLWDRGDLLRAILATNFPVLDDSPEEAATESLLGDELLAPEPPDAIPPDIESQCAEVVGLEIPAVKVGTIGFPRKLILKKPGSKQLSAQFTQVRTWIQSLADCRHVRIEYRETRHPVLGRNTLPNSAWVDSLNDALLLINRSKEAKRFTTVSRRIVAHDARLLAWLHKRSLKAFELLPVCEKLVKVHEKMRGTPASGVFLRQLSVPGVDTKFIEKHRETLAEWLDLTLPEHAINDKYQGIKGFASRYGYRGKPLRLRLRSLDANCPFPGFLQPPTPTEKHAPENTQAGGLLSADVTLDISVISQLKPAHRRVLITENEINYLALPDMNGTLALFGAGYGWQSLQDITWLQTLEVFYWGDIDTHGLAILDDLRAYLPHVQSLMMDRDTLLAHESHWGQEPTPTVRQLERLSEAERGLYDELVVHRYGNNIRLEQEQLDFDYVARVLAELR